MQLNGCILCIISDMVEDEVFKALADPTRRLILDELAEKREQTFFELCARLIMKHHVKMSRQAMAKHLSILERAGLVKSEHKRRYKVLTFNNVPIEKMVERWIK
jgi:DNA-binding transcriptional ArsR family regulator